MNEHIHFLNLGYDANFESMKVGYDLSVDVIYWETNINTENGTARDSSALSIQFGSIRCL